MKQIETLPTNEWTDTSNWVMADTCLKCYNLNCNQLLNSDGKVILYICPISTCKHEWQPYTKIKMETTVYCRCKLI